MGMGRGVVTAYAGEYGRPEWFGLAETFRGTRLFHALWLRATSTEVKRADWDEIVRVGRR
jgi:hypothetical protein